MRAVWQIAISSLKAKPGRTILLMLAVAIATSLAVAITGGVTMAKELTQQRIRQIVGQTGLRVINTQVGGITRDIHEKIRSFPGIAYAPAQRRQLFTLHDKKQEASAIDDHQADGDADAKMVLAQMQLTLVGIDPKVDLAIASRQTGREKINTLDGRPLTLGESLPIDQEGGEADLGADTQPAPLVIGSQVQRLMDLKPGDQLYIKHPKDGQRRFAFEVTGVIYRTGSMLFQRPIGYVSMKTHDKLTKWFKGIRPEAANTESMKRLELSGLIASGIKSAQQDHSSKPAPALMPALGPSASTLDDPLNYSWIDLVPDSSDPLAVEQMIDELEAALPDDYQLRSKAAQSSQVAQWDSQLALLVLCISGVVFMSAGFIVLTSMLSSLAQQRRQLAILRCVGCSRWLIGRVQLLTGGLLGVGGAMLGVPMGMLMLYGMHAFRKQSEMAKIKSQLTPLSDTGETLPIPESSQGVLAYFERSMPFEMDVTGVINAALMAAVATLVAALIPAYFAVRTSPLKAMISSPRFKSGHLLLIGILSLLSLSLAMYLALGTLPVGLKSLLANMQSGEAQTDVDVRFWLYVYLGLPLTFIGYFLLAIPLAYLVSWLTGHALATLFRLPVSLFSQTVRAMPYRLGLTAGALMVGLSILLGIWTDGRSIMDGWFDKIKMPDAILAGLPFIGISDDNLAELKKIPEIQTVSSSSAYSVRADSINKDPNRRFGVSGLGGKSTLFVAADVDAFVSMTELEWIDGDKASALKRLSDGAAILVSREYKVAHDIKLGDYLYLQTPRGKVPFEIAGVIASPGLDIAVHHFDIGASFEDASVASVFGTREDGAIFFGPQKANMALLSFKPGVTQDEQEALLTVIAGKMSVLAQSSRQIKENVIEWANRMMRYMSLLALASLFIACLGVGNLVVTNIQSRQFEFGVLRATGSSGFLMTRLILAESLVVAITGCLCGTLLGYQLSTVSAALRNQAFGLGYTPEIPWDIAAYGYLAIFIAATFTCLPAALQMMRKSPRELVQ